MSSNMPHGAQHVVDQRAPALSDFHDHMLAVLPSLRQQALALTRNRADADDLVQTAVTSALAAKASFEPGTNFRAWMGSILRNRFLSDCRRRRPTASLEDAPPSSLARSGGQEESLAMKELHHHLARLPAEQRLLLLLISVQGVSYENASAQMGVPVGTLKARVSRTRAQLRLWIMGETAAQPSSRGLGSATPREQTAAPGPRRTAGVTAGYHGMQVT
jgi:RNA polymerase sigma-70 factor (ECF subfamily)